jgi:hypothetical protein
MAINLPSHRRIPYDIPTSCPHYRPPNLQELYQSAVTIDSASRWRPRCAETRRAELLRHDTASDASQYRVCKHTLGMSCGKRALDRLPAWLTVQVKFLGIY